MTYRTRLENDINFNIKTGSIAKNRPSVPGRPGLPVSATVAGRANPGSLLTATTPCLGHWVPLGTRLLVAGDLQPRAAPRVQTHPLSINPG
jgi:hypothetical protein